MKGELQDVGESAENERVQQNEATLYHDEPDMDIYADMMRDDANQQKGLPKEDALLIELKEGPNLPGKKSEQEV